MTDLRKFAIYSRKSKFTGKGESIGNQIEMCTRELKATYHIDDKDIVVFEDEGFSGGNINRPIIDRKALLTNPIKTCIIKVYPYPMRMQSHLPFC